MGGLGLSGGGGWNRLRGPEGGNPALAGLQSDPARAPPRAPGQGGTRDRSRRSGTVANPRSSSPRRRTAPTTMSGAAVILKALQDQGVEVVFGYPGGAVLPIYDELFKTNAVRHVLVRHAQAAVHAAEG